MENNKNCTERWHNYNQTTAWANYLFPLYFFAQLNFYSIFILGTSLQNEKDQFKINQHTSNFPTTKSILTLQLNSNTTGKYQGVPIPRPIYKNSRQFNVKKYKVWEIYTTHTLTLYLLAIWNNVLVWVENFLSWFSELRQAELELEMPVSKHTFHKEYIQGSKYHSFDYRPFL